MLLTELCSDDDDVDGNIVHHSNKNYKTKQDQNFLPQFHAFPDHIPSTRHSMIIDFITGKQIITLEIKSIEFIDKIRYAEWEQEKANELHRF